MRAVPEGGLRGGGDHHRPGLSAVLHHEACGPPPALSNCNFAATPFSIFFSELRLAKSSLISIRIFYFPIFSSEKQPSSNLCLFGSIYVPAFFLPISLAHLHTSYSGLSCPLLRFIASMRMRLLCLFFPRHC